MRCWCICLCFLSLLSPTEALFGQEAASLPARLRWAEFSVVMGRLTVRSERYGQNMSTATGNEQTGERESFTITVTGGQPTVRYDHVTADESFLAEIVSGNQVHLLREPRGEGRLTPVQFVQDASGKLALSIGADGERRVFLADTLWHLLLAQPEECRQHLLPLLALLRSDWDLADTAAELQHELLQSREAGSAAQRGAWQKLVTQLNSPSFAARQSAERALREQGLAVAPFLKELNRRSLTGEQRQRVARVLGEVVGDSEDTPERLAAWLAADRQIWLTLLARPDFDHRQVAAARLSHLVGQELEFDPAAPLAVRQKQIERLEKQWAAK